MMKKLVLCLLTLGVCAQTHTQILQDAQTVLTTAFTYSKTLVTQHPYITAAVGACAVIGAVVVYANKSDTITDPLVKKVIKDVPDDTVVVHKPTPLRVKSVSPTDSPDTSPTTSPASKLQKLADK